MLSTTLLKSTKKLNISHALLLQNQSVKLSPPCFKAAYLQPSSVYCTASGKGQSTLRTQHLPGKNWSPAVGYQVILMVCLSRNLPHATVNQTSCPILILLERRWMAFCRTLEEFCTSQNRTGFKVFFGYPVKLGFLSALLFDCEQDVTFLLTPKH